MGHGFHGYVSHKQRVQESGLYQVFCVEVLGDHPLSCWGVRLIRRLQVNLKGMVGMGGI